MAKRRFKLKIKWNITRVMSAIALLFSLIFMILLKILNVLPIKYFLIVLILYIIMNGLLLFFSFVKKQKKRKGKIIVSLCALLLTVASIFGSFYFYKTIRFIGSFGSENYKTENYSVIVLKDSSYNQIEDINGKELGMIAYDSEGKNKAKEHINSKIKATFKDYETPQSLEEDLINKKIEIILIEDSYKSMLEEIDENFDSKIKVIYTFSIQIKTESIVKSADVTKQPFSIYISGIDTYGKISSVSRSDVNMVATVNPTTHQVLLISIPRDYYVQLHGTKGYKDKLTHAGIYGVDMSVKTIEDLLGIDINYYVKVNFSSVIKIVDVLGGVDVYSEYAFNSYSGYKIAKGYNHLDGKQALDFARTRKAFASGDRQRGKNQQAVIESLIRKCSSSAIITKYASLLDSIHGSFQTNLTDKEISNLAKFQLDNMPTWTVKSVSLDGSDASAYTYSYGSSRSYVMAPYESSIKEAQQALSEILGGQVQKSSYDGKIDNIKTPSTVQTNESNNTDNTNNSNNDSISNNKTQNTSISLSNSDITINVGDKTLIKANVSPNNSNVVWSSSDSTIATVNNGEVIAKKAGKVTITATVDNKKAECIVRIIDPLEDLVPSNNSETDNNNDNDDVILNNNTNENDTDLNNNSEEENQPNG